MKIILMHGKDAKPEDKWYPWFVEQMKLLGHEVHVPELPNTNDPVLSEWTEELVKLQPDENTILIGHSRGGVVILRWLENLKDNTRVKKVILMATNSGLESKRTIIKESNFGFFNEAGYDFPAIKKHCQDFVVMHSKDDQWVPFDHGAENSQALNAKFYEFEDYQHFGRSVNQIPELLEEIAKE